MIQAIILSSPILGMQCQRLMPRMTAGRLTGIGRSGTTGCLHRSYCSPALPARPASRAGTCLSSGHHTPCGHTSAGTWVQQRQLQSPIPSTVLSGQWVPSGIPAADLTKLLRTPHFSRQVLACCSWSVVQSCIMNLSRQTP